MFCHPKYDSPSKKKLCNFNWLYLDAMIHVYFLSTKHLRSYQIWSPIQFLPGECGRQWMEYINDHSIYLKDLDAQKIFIQKDEGYGNHPMKDTQHWYLFQLQALFRKKPVEIMNIMHWLIPKWSEGNEDSNRTLPKFFCFLWGHFLFICISLSVFPYLCSVHFHALRNPPRLDIRNYKTLLVFYFILRVRVFKSEKYRKET